jgi:hypothetical protein
VPISVFKQSLELKGGKTAVPAEVQQDDVSTLSDSSAVKLVQFQLQVLRQRPQVSGGYTPYQNYFYNNYSGQFGQGHSVNYGNYYGNSNVGNSYYYRHGGRPYYNGGNSGWYGNRPRSSIQIGPNLGVYWY